MSDEKQYTDGFEKLANRIRFFLVIAVMIVGAAILMGVPSAFTIFGYSNLVIIFFFLAATGGIALSYTIIF